eukprot:SAG22_NODE_7715_length_715_cov_1.123377_1_plen_167_part_10
MAAANTGMRATVMATPVDDFEATELLRLRETIEAVRETAGQAHRTLAAEVGRQTERLDGFNTAAAQERSRWQAAVDAVAAQSGAALETMQGRLAVAEQRVAEQQQQVARQHCAARLLSRAEQCRQCRQWADAAELLAAAAAAAADMLWCGSWGAEGVEAVGQWEEAL